MRRIIERLHVGGTHDCRSGSSTWAVVHACKHPCHRRVLNYSNNLHRTHPNYLTYRDGNDLYLNMIDADQPLFMLPLFTVSLGFMSEQWDAGRSLLIHCNQGGSRAPSLALLHMAKNLELVDSGSFNDARQAFKAHCPWYSPGGGIRIYLRQHWHEIG